MAVNTRDKCVSQAAVFLFLAILIVALCVRAGWALATGLALFPLQWAVYRIIWAVEAKPAPVREDFGQGPDQ